MTIFLTSFVLMFIAELGDKTQLAALAFAAKFKLIWVILGLFLAFLLNNFIAVAAGSFIGSNLPLLWVEIISYSLFIAFGIWTIFDSTESDSASKKVIINQFFTVFLLLFISEFGDKSQIATMTLSIKYQTPVAVFLGAIGGQMAANALSVGIGALMGKHLPIKTIKWISAVMFIAVGLIGIISLFLRKGAL